MTGRPHFLSLLPIPIPTVQFGESVADIIVLLMVPDGSDTSGEKYPELCEG